MVHCLLFRKIMITFWIKVFSSDVYWSGLEKLREAVGELE